MKTSYIIYIVLLSLLYCSCNFDQKQNIFIGENQYIKTFNDTITLNGKKIDIENMGANTIDVVDSFLVFSCSQLDTFYNVYSKYTYQHCGNFVPKGRGDNELPMISFPLFCKNGNNHSLVYLDDMSTGTIKALDLTQSCAEQKTIFSLPSINIKKIPGFRFLYPIQDSIYFLHGLNHSNRKDYYALYNEQQKQYTILDTIFRYSLQDIGDMFLYNTSNVFNPLQQKYATAMQFFNQINIYSLAKPQQHFSIIVGERPTRLKDVEETLMPEKFEFYEDMTGTNALLFAVYANRTRKDWAILEDVPSEIHVFDWDGNPRYLLKIKEKLAHIALDEERKILYGMTLSEAVYQYDISKIL